MNPSVRTTLQASALALSLSFLNACAPKPTASTALPVETGVARTLAEHRKAVLRHIGYDLHLNIPAGKEAPILASEKIRFELKDNTQPLQVDFKDKTEQLQEVRVNGKKIAIEHTNEHVVIPARHLKKGKNEVGIKFIAGDLSLNRNEEYLYTLLVPDRARTVFPCFDQPDLKASYTLTLTLPAAWKAQANAPLQDSVLAGSSKTYRYLPSDTISTYLFSFAAGEFSRVVREENGRKMEFLHRETDPAKIRESMDPVFGIHADALQFMEAYTQIPYPFRKFDFVAIPDFQYGGMEHVGTIQYKASTLFLDEGATQDQKIARSNLIAHETAHMWFGDLVTMEWFNDVWMKEVFANFMADKITQVSLKDSNYDLKFLVDHFPAAYGVDRTAGANPIRQNLENLQDAGSLYGNIIYHKAPIVMRQLERLMGEQEFRLGLQQYLKMYAHGNASWPDLIEILDARTPTDLQAWNQVWVNEAGRPQIDYQMQVSNQKITSFTVSQKGEDDSERLWPQFFEVALVYKDSVEELTIDMNARQVVVQEALGKQQPDFILFNSSGQGYGLFPVAQKYGNNASEVRKLNVLSGLKDPVMRAAAYLNLYENLLSGRVGTDLLLAFTAQEAARESEELNVKLLTGQQSDIFWRFTSPARRQQVAAQVEAQLWQAMQQHTQPNSKKLLFKAYQSIALTQVAQERLYQVWKEQKAPAGVKLTEDDYTSLAAALALRDYPDSKAILEEQTNRISNPDRKKRMQFLMPALSGKVQERDAFFASLTDPRNREKEAWVATALGYLHHPLRAATSEKYLQQSLELVEEIQLTGDIFFPTNWLQATFGYYQSPEAAATIRTFLEARPDYNPKLKGKILQAADNVFRAEQLVKQPR